MSKRGRSRRFRASHILRALQRRWWLITAAVVLFFAAKATIWPRYLKWFHTRQEAAVFAEKISGKIIKISMPFSPRLHRKITAWVYLPPGYNRSGARFPVVYILHGMPGEVRDCFVKGRVHDAAEALIHAHKIQPLILVSFDAHGPQSPADVTNFLNRADGSWSMEDFMVKELVPWVDHKYHTIPRPEERALIGVSAGGYGALNLLFKHPDIWKVAGSHTGFFSTRDEIRDMTKILGPPGPLWDENDPMKTVDDVSPEDNLHVYMDIGNWDDLLGEFKKFDKKLAARHIDHEAHIFPGRHTWQYWSAHFYDSLSFADRCFHDESKSAVPAQPTPTFATLPHFVQ